MADSTPLRGWLAGRREASDIIKKGRMCSLFINDLDAGACPPAALPFPCLAGWGWGILIPVLPNAPRFSTASTAWSASAAS